MTPVRLHFFKTKKVIELCKFSSGAREEFSLIKNFKRNHERQKIHDALARPLFRLRSPGVLHLVLQKSQLARRKMWVMNSIEHVTGAEALSLSPVIALSQWPQGHQWKANRSASPFYPQPSRIQSGKGDKSNHR